MRLRLILLFTIISYAFSLAGYAQSKKHFEGEIVYRNFENHNKLVRKLSKGMAYNGSRTVKVLLKSYNMHIIDESLHIHTLLLPDENKIIVFNDLLKKGQAFSFGTYAESYLSAYSPDPRNISGQILENEYSVKKTSKTDYMGQSCDIYKGQITAKTGAGGAVCNAEIWVSPQYTIYKSYWYFLNGIQVPGIALKWTTDQHGKVPLLGTMSSYVASEVKEIKERSIADEEMQVPSDCQIVTSDSPFKILRLYKDTRKYLKKNKMYPADAEEDTEVTYKIEEEWDF